jgi:hypothetical protein
MTSTKEAKHYSNGKYVFELFPESFIQLQLEMQHHPLLIQRLQKHAGLGMEVIFAETCHYCGYEINAELDGEQLEALADVLRGKLAEMAVREAIAGYGDDWQKEAWKFGKH